MKRLTVLLSVVILSVFLWSCGKSDSADKIGDQTTTEKQKIVDTKPKLPEGYPAELSIPPGFKPINIKTGSGIWNSAGGEKTPYKSYEIWRMMPKNAPEIIEHYKKLLADLEYEGEWKGDGVNESARGVFKKGQNEITLSISPETFKFELMVWDK